MIGLMTPRIWIRFPPSEYHRCALLIVCLAAASIRAFPQEPSIRLRPSSDYRFLAADLIAARPGSSYRWTVNNVPSREGSLAETFHLAADGDLVTARGEKPISAAGAVFVPGRFGQGFIAPSGGVPFATQGLYDPHQGTVEFWISPLRDGSSAGYAADLPFFAYAASNGDSLYVRQASTGIVCAQATIGGAYLSAYSNEGSMRSWKAGSWHHVVFVFSESQNYMRMYVDGRAAGDTNEGRYVAPAGSTRFALGNPMYAMDSVRITRETLDPSRVAAEAARRDPPFSAEVIFPLTGLSAGDEVAITAGAARGSFIYLGPPLSDARPDSTLLPAGSTSLRLRVSSPVPAEVRWSLNEELPFGSMHPFDSGSGRTVHETEIRNLSPDPMEMNRVYLRSSAAPDFTLMLSYRSVPAMKADYPRIANLWSWRLADPEYRDYTARLQLAVLGWADPQSLRRIRSVNPGVILLATLQPLEYFDGEPSIPDEYYLRDVSGERITLWPGSHRLNLTKPEVVEFNARRIRETISAADLLFDGVFFDSFILDVSYNKKDAYGNPIRIDADGDGNEDDPVVLDAAWRKGMLEMVRLWRETMPGAIATGHLSKGADELGEYFDGDNLAFICIDAIEGRIRFSDIWDRYHGWEKGGMGPNVSVIDVGAPNELGYGYGVYSSFEEAERRIPPGVLDFARTWYPSMRFGLAFALMGNGLFERHFSDVLYCEEWTYDEFDYRLGAPLGPAEYARTAGAPEPIPRPLFSDGDFENPGNSSWSFFVQPNQGVLAYFSYDADAASGQRSARIEVRALPPSAQPHFVNFYRDGVKVRKGVSYVVRFSAKADTPRPLVVSLQRRAGDWEGLGLWKRFEMGREWKEYTVGFTATGGRSDAGLQFFLADATGVVHIDDVFMDELPPDVYRRDFEKGIVLLNGTSEPKTIPLGDGFSRIVGAQAPKRQYVIDDDGPGVKFSGGWSTVHRDTHEWKVEPPFYHDWGSTCREAVQRDAAAEYDLMIPEDGTYTIRVWLPDAPNRSSRTKAAVYEIVALGKIIASAKIDQTRNPDAWRDVAQVALKTRDRPILRIRNSQGQGLLYADAVYVESAARYNDGSPAREVVLEPFDGIVLRRR